MNPTDKAISSDTNPAFWSTMPLQEKIPKLRAFLAKIESIEGMLEKSQDSHSFIMSRGSVILLLCLIIGWVLAMVSPYNKMETVLLIALVAFLIITPIYFFAASRIILAPRKKKARAKWDAECVDWFTHRIAPRDVPEDILFSDFFYDIDKLLMLRGDSAKKCLELRERLHALQYQENLKNFLHQFVGLISQLGGQISIMRNNSLPTLRNFSEKWAEKINEMANDAKISFYDDDMPKKAEELKQDQKS